MYLVAVVALFSVVTWPGKASDFAGMVILALSGAADGFGDFLAALLGR